MFIKSVGGYNFVMEKGLLLRNVNPAALSDVKKVVIDCNLPVSERVKAFIGAAKSPYLFNVNGKAVKVVFDRNGKTLEECLIGALKNSYRN